MGAREFCDIAASTKRQEARGGGQTGPPVDYLEEVMITQLYPLAPETVMMMGLSSPREAKECFHVPAEGADLPDIREGDLLIVDSAGYVVRSVAEWPDLAGGIPFLHIVVDEVKGAYPAL